MSVFLKHIVSADAGALNSPSLSIQIVNIIIVSVTFGIAAPFGGCVCRFLWLCAYNCTNMALLDYYQLPTLPCVEKWNLLIFIITYVESMCAV